jgi:hypothetical protein
MKYINEQIAAYLKFILQGSIRKARPALGVQR